MKQRKMITWLLVLTIALSLFSAAAFGSEPEAGESPAAGEAAGETLGTEEAEAAEGEEPEAEEEEAEEPAEPAESEELAETEEEEEAASEEPSLLLGSGANGGILLASDDGSGYVAYVGNDGYTDLAAAITAANVATADVTIKMNDDVEISSQLTISNTSAEITLDLNGHSITRSENYLLQVTSNATLTVTDGSTDGDGVISGVYGINNYGTLNISGGTISATSTAIYNNSSGTVNVNGGTVSVTSSTSGTFYAISGNGGTISVSDGTISATGGTSGTINAVGGNGGTISVSGGTIAATGGANSYGIYLINSTEVEVSGGDISGGKRGIVCTESNTQTLNISGGTITGVQSYGIRIVNGEITITAGAIVSEGDIGIALDGGNFSMSGGSVSGSTHGVNLNSNEADITAEITGGTISGGTFGVYAQANASYALNLTIDDGNAKTVISGTTAGLGVAGGAVATVSGGSISGRFGMYVVESTTGSPTTLIVDGEATVSGTDKAVRGVVVNTYDMVITISNGTYNTQVATDYLAAGVTQIGYTKNGETVYYVDSSTAQAGRVAELIENAGAGETVEITVTDGDLTLTNIGSTVADVHITSESTGTVSVNNTALGSETVSFHVLTKTEAKDATCTEDGNIEYWTCSVCGKYFSDENGATEITDTSSLTISATGHTYGKPTFTWAADGKSATATYTCVKGDDTQTVKSDVTSAVKTAATCTAMGTTTYTAVVTVDGVEYSETMDVEDIPANGHSFGAWETVTSPTCEDDGSEQRVCTVCGYTETQGVDPTGHEWEAEYTIDKEPTCTTDGSQSIHCRNCDAVKDSQVIPAAGHSYEAEVTAATYTARGYTVYTCSVCGDSYEGDYTPILTIDVTDDSIEIRPVLEPLTAVPESLAALYSTVDALSSELLSRVTVSQGYTAENAAVYDIKLQFRVDGGEWIDATVDNFPLGGIPVTLPYPDGTDSSYEFTAVHMFTVTSDRLGITAGDTETLTVTNTTEGITATVNGCSPIAIAWKEGTAVTPIATATATASPASTAPSTGDDSHLFLWLALAAVCACGLAAPAVIGRKREKE